MSILDFEKKVAEIESRLSEISTDNQAEVKELQQQLHLYKNPLFLSLYHSTFFVLHFLILK